MVASIPDRRTAGRSRSRQWALLVGFAVLALQLARFALQGGGATVDLGLLAVPVGQCPRGGVLGFALRLTLALTGSGFAFDRAPAAQFGLVPYPRVIHSAMITLE